MNKLKNDSGFSAVEAVLVLVVIGILGFTGWFVYHAKQIADKNLSSNSSTTPTYKKPTTKTATTDQYAGWKQYCSDAGSTCFKYPTNWTTAATMSGSDDASIMGVDITSPNKAVKIMYEPVLQGLGGACEPGVCTFNTTSIDTLSNTSASNLRIVKGVFESRDGDYMASPEYCVTSTTYIERLGLKIGEVNVGFTAFTYPNPKSDGIEMLCVQSTNSSDTFTTLKAAQDWLAGSDVSKAGKALSSIQLK